jgi:hypothetical protein
MNEKRLPNEQEGVKKDQGMGQEKKDIGGQEKQGQQGQQGSEKIGQEKSGQDVKR